MIRIYVPNLIPIMKTKMCIGAALCMTAMGAQAQTWNIGGYAVSSNSVINWVAIAVLIFFVTLFLIPEGVKKKDARILALMPQILLFITFCIWTVIKSVGIEPLYLAIFGGMIGIAVAPFLIIGFAVAVLVVLEWLIGRAIGKSVSQNTGIILGIMCILLGFSIIIGIAIIIYSQKNKTSVTVNLMSNQSVNPTTAQSTARLDTYPSDDTRECPYCAEIIKRRASVCRFCGKAVSAE
jgi:putative Mn2+ efflux pump MntP